MKKADAEEYTQALGQVVSGSWRLIANARNLGVPKALGMSVDEWVNEYLGGFVKLQVEERRKAIAELLEEGLSQRAVAEVLGVGIATVNRDAADDSVPNGTGYEKKQRKDATSEPDSVPNGTPLEHDDLYTDVKVVHVAKPVDTLAVLSATDEIRKQAEQEQHHRTRGTGENEWHTPEMYVGLVRKVLGRIDLDPASTDEAQKVIGAVGWMTADDDGLSEDWHGRVFLNPPYAQPLIAQFVSKLLHHVETGEVPEAILLTHNYTDTRWFQDAASKASVICFPAGRIRFVSPAGDLAAPTQGQAFFYFGRNTETFEGVFESIGAIMFPLKAWDDYGGK